MKSDIILIDNQGKGFTEALEETKKVASYTGLEPKLTTRLQLMTEEMLSLARSVTGEMQASFWIENEGSQFDLHMATKTIMDKEKRYNLLSTASSRKNEAAKSFLGKLRDKLEEAMAAEVDHSEEEIPMDIIKDLANHPIEDPEWDGYERSVLRRLADTIKIAIRGGQVEIIVSKNFAK
ncbi:MAG: hypothetical protein J6A79_14550 [Clostridia bacterium]|nr:hypothetical protein [Clostridia bacterium]